MTDLAIESRKRSNAGRAAAVHASRKEIAAGNVVDDRRRLVAIVCSASGNLVEWYDFYFTNSDAVLSYNYAFVPGGAWLTPTSIQPARDVKVSGQVDF
jgi:hypothetical protein